MGVEHTVSNKLFEKQDTVSFIFGKKKNGNAFDDLSKRIIEMAKTRTCGKILGVSSSFLIGIKKNGVSENSKNVQLKSSYFHTCGPKKL